MHRVISDSENNVNDDTAPDQQQQPATLAPFDTITGASTPADRSSSRGPGEQSSLPPQVILEEFDTVARDGSLMHQEPQTNATALSQTPAPSHFHHPNHSVVLIKSSSAAAMSSSTLSELSADGHFHDEDGGNQQDYQNSPGGNSEQHPRMVLSSSVDEHYMAQFRTMSNYYRNDTMEHALLNVEQPQQHHQQNHHHHHHPPVLQRRASSPPRTTTLGMRRSQTPAATLQRMADPHVYSASAVLPAMVLPEMVTSISAPPEILMDGEESSSGSQRYSQNSSSRDWGWFEDVHMTGHMQDGVSSGGGAAPVGGSGTVGAAGGGAGAKEDGVQGMNISGGVNPTNSSTRKHGAADSEREGEGRGRGHKAPKKRGLVPQVSGGEVQGILTKQDSVGKSSEKASERHA